MKDRAITEEQKKEVLEKIFQFWIKYPEMRLGQLIENARLYIDEGKDLFYIEDYALIEILDQFVKSFSDRKEI